MRTGGGAQWSAVHKTSESAELLGSAIYPSSRTDLEKSSRSLSFSIAGILALSDGICQLYVCSVSPMTSHLKTFYFGVGERKEVEIFRKVSKW